jgi:hypothetical protein
MMTRRQTLNVKGETIVKSLAPMKWGLGWTSDVSRLTLHENRHGDQAAN